MKKNCDDVLSRFHLIPERNGQTDRLTDRFAISISRVSKLTRDKNGKHYILVYNMNVARGDVWGF